MAAAPSSAANVADYRLGPGDGIKISVFQNPDLALETRITDTGMVTYPLIGAVKIGGLTVPQAEQRIANALSSGNFVKQPQVSILIMQVRGNQAAVLGHVNRPGRYPLELAQMRLTDLLAVAGGVAESGSDVVTLVGVRDGRPFKTQISLSDALAAGQLDSAFDTRVQDGDVVYVDRAPTAYIYGEVQRPGPLRVERGMTLLQGLAAGGGLTARGTDRGLKVHRKASDGHVEVLQPSMSEPLRDGDVVYVRESIF
ncbi:polysaccharide export protein EpsE [Azohydromonas caseinilytica]|uniref:Polysaccharide export protein EpsE n=1 Tax=Azohydromonas caseinilytica TaxID=2728836 RepID=A0A848FGV4_9BURK|nr:polysaccharide export protein EpsE [Azohydromonas caseinilytica]NML17529.1 polysaccharide export protein EpsE [Azohydromonas caseinilytica]